MNFYIDFLYIPISFLIIYLPIFRTVSNKNLYVIKSGQTAVNPCSIGIKFFTLLNNTSESDYFVELLPDECCIDTDGTLDCDSLKIIGECVDILPKGNQACPAPILPYQLSRPCPEERTCQYVWRQLSRDVFLHRQSKSLNLVAPTVNPLERKGFCTIHIDSKPVDRKSIVMRDTIKIKFDTTIKNDANLRTVIAPCTNIDEDPLNECKPVNCEHYYNGIKNYFDKHNMKCVNARLCDENEIYDDKDNDCQRSDAITETDLNFLKTLVMHGRPHKDLVIIKTVHCPKKVNYSKSYHKEEEVDENKFDYFEPVQKKPVNSTKLKVNIVVNETSPHKPVQPPCELSSQEGQEITNLFSKIKKNIHKVISIIKNNKYCIIVLFLIVFLQCFMLIAMMYYMKCCGCCQVKKKKVKCKFFNYRQDASITTPLIGTSNIDTETTEFNYVSESSYIDKKIKCYKACHKQPTDAKISMSDDILTKYLNRRDWNTKLSSAQNVKNVSSKSNLKADIQVHRKDDCKADRKEKDANKKERKERKDDRRTTRMRNVDIESSRSEREMKCHDYNFNVDESKRFIKKTASLSTEKGAQACFSNDSVDDFLSEKGILLFGDNISKYSLNTSSPARSSYTDTSSKTSKNNILRHFISFLSRKSKMAVNSEPGKGSKDKLELLHMSKVSLQSSSDSNINKLKSNKFFKESRSTF